MCSIRNRAFRVLSVPLAAVAVLVSTGCQRVKPAPVAALNDSPMVVDEAMQMRDWDRSTAYYQNGDTVAGFTGRYYELKPKYQDGYITRAADPVVGITNVVLLPITMAMTPPWEDVRYQGVIVPPTHHANPPMDVIK